MTAPRVPILATARLLAWPEHAEGGRAHYLELGHALARRYSTDTHTAGYSVPTVERRLAKGAPEALPDGVPMVALLVDVDGAGHAASPAWRAAEAAKLARLSTAHPGVVAYHSRGGHRPVTALPRPFVIRDQETASAWKRFYLRQLGYISRRFAIVADPACADWTRLYRLPHATRDVGGRPEALRVHGDLERVGTWDYAPSWRDIADDDAEVRRLATVYTAWKQHARILLPRPPAPPPRTEPVSSAYGAAALDRECSAVRRTGKGDRNGQLNRSAYALGQLVAAGILDRGQVERELVAAAVAAGLDEGEIAATVASGLEAGKQTPRAFMGRRAA